MKIELTARCDFKCFFCATGFKLREKADMDWGLLCRLLKETPFMDAWQGMAFQALRRANLCKDVTGTACETCIAYQ